MRSERAQGTVEYIGVLLVVAALLVGLAGAVGASDVLAGVFTRAIGTAFGIDHAAGVPDASAAEQARFAAAVDPSRSPDERPSLGDVRLELIERHGDAQGRAIYRELVVGEAMHVVKSLGGTRRFGTITTPVADGSTIDHLVALERALSPPQPGDPGELETPSGVPNAHVVTASEEDAAFGAALHPGTDWTSVFEDGVSAVPAVGTVMGVGRIAFRTARLAAAAATVVADANDVRDLDRSLSPSASDIPAGSRAGDIVVTWEAVRHSGDGRTTWTVERGAVVRDGRVLEVALKPRL